MLDRHPLMEEVERVARVNAYQEAPKLGKLEERHKQALVEQEQRFQAAEAAVEYHADGSPICKPIRVGTGLMDRPIFLRFFRMCPNDQQREDTPEMRAARLTMARAQEFAEIPPRFTLAFIGEQIPEGFVPRARVTGGVYEDTTTNLTTQSACSLDSEHEEVVVPLAAPVDEMCTTILALILYHVKQRRESMPPVEGIPFDEPGRLLKLDEQRREWLAELEQQANSEAKMIWQQIGADILKEAEL